MLSVAQGQTPRGAEPTDMAEASLSNAVDAWRRGQGAEAEGLARAIVSRDPDHVDAHRLLTEVLSVADRRSEAIAAARRVLELAPRDAGAHRRLAELLSRDGDPPSAIALLERSLELEPGNTRALNNLANLLTGQGRVSDAIQLLDRVIARQPNYPAAWVNRGVALLRANRLQEAIDNLHQALKLNRAFPEAWLNLAQAYSRANNPMAALDCCKQAQVLRPPDAGALTGCGEVYLRLRRFAEALTSFEDALASDPHPGAAHLGRVHALLGLKRAADALAACNALLERQAPAGIAGLRATALLALGRVADALHAAAVATNGEPNDPQSFITLGLAALHSGTHATALLAFERAVGLAPAVAKAHEGRGLTLEATGRVAEAIDAYEEAARLDPLNTDLGLRGGLLMLKVGFGSSALAAFDAVLAADGTHLGAKKARAMALLALGRHDEAAHAFGDLEACEPTLDYLAGYVFNLRLWRCDWETYDCASRDIAARIIRGERAEVPLSFLAHSLDPAEQRRCAEIYVADKCVVATPGATRPDCSDRSDRSVHSDKSVRSDRSNRSDRSDGSDGSDGSMRSDRSVRLDQSDRSRLRIAYLSYDFRDHPVAQLTAGLFESHDRSRFEVYALSTAADDDSGLRRRLRAAFEHFEDVSALTDEAIAERIAALGIDVLVDLGGHTLGSRTRVLAYRPAAVQISFLGFPGTLGADFIDYIVADRHVIPAEERGHYTEQVIYMPDSYLPLDFAHLLPPVPDRRAAGLPADALVLCCFNAAFKFTPTVFGGWMRVLRDVPHGILWLREGSAAMQRHLAREAAVRGVDPERLIYAPRLPTAAGHRARFALADLFLDTTPYNAHTTASEALAVGVPVITQRGRTFASRVATSLLHAVGLGHLSAATPADYERLAIELALSPHKLAMTKAHLREVRHSAPLFDTVGFCRHLEDAFLEALARQRRAAPLGPLHVQRRADRQVGCKPERGLS